MEEENVGAQPPLFNALAAPLGRLLLSRSDSGSEGQAFESPRAHHSYPLQTLGSDPEASSGDVGVKRRTDHLESVNTPLRRSNAADENVTRSCEADPEPRRSVFRRSVVSRPTNA